MVQFICSKCGTPSTTQETTKDGVVVTCSPESPQTTENKPVPVPTKAAEADVSKEDAANLTRIGRFVKKGTDRVLVDESNWKDTSNRSEDGKYAILVDDKVRVDWEGNEIERKQELTIVSIPLVKAFVSVVRYYPGISLGGNEIVLTAPYAPLFFYYDDLSKIVQEKEDSSPELKQDFKVLAHFYTRWVKQSHDDIRTRIQKGVVLFEDLWAVFRPGDFVYSLDELGEPCLHGLGAGEYRRAENSGYQEYSIRRFKRFSVDLWNVTWDKAGGVFQRITATRSIRIYSEARKISSLPFYPLSPYYAEGNQNKIDALLDTLKERGNKWKGLVSEKPACQLYQGAARQLTNGNDTEYMDERVMVDASATMVLMGKVNQEFVANFNFSSEYLKRQTPGLIGRAGDSKQTIEYEWPVHGAGMDEDFAEFDDFPRDRPFTDRQAQLCPSSVLCYAIKSRAWYEVSLSKLKDVEWDKSGLGSLVIDPDTKKMLAGLVEQHRKNRVRGLSDIVQSKGKGLIIVLFGTPGVGKTLTAETVAEYTKKPLYPINIGELSSQNDLVERLSMHFNRASRWDAVLLLDEADVLLEKRSYENLQRNAVVSVFLRMLEYYEGIIFLTTNRLLTMDSAFESRIQLAIELEDLTTSSRRQIWKNLINRLDEDEDVGKKELLDHLDELAEWELNGRQIRNVLSTAESFALGTQRRRGALRFKMVEKMANRVIDFHEFFEDKAHERKAQLGMITSRQFQERRRFG
ncbi:putative atpase aaa+ type core [Podospora fimiseda]|uniref:Atpase aaa+ type core n=1 Tax=Podospora fimiseda TaxID=252190 RepID=A0AAN7GXS8_9PEZI|nr:putative atpase aaa+ type core [Podospora fimiseda]